MHWSDVLYYAVGAALILAFFGASLWFEGRALGRARGWRARGDPWHGLWSDGERWGRKGG
jgi:hypothetical protein